MLDKLCVISASSCCAVNSNYPHTFQAEFDRPAELLKNKDGKLRALVDESADKDHLLEMVKAKEHLDRRN